MKSKFLTLTALLLILFALPALASTYRVELGGGLSGDPDGNGIAILTIDGTDISYTMTYHDIGTPTGAHIHRGADDESGDVVVDLMPNFGASSASGAVTASESIIDEIKASPAGFYVNIHTTDLPNGAIRGQLELVASAPDALTLTLRGENEVPGPGDPDGIGVVTLDLHLNSIDYTFQIDNVMNPTGAHIHTGTALESGPVFVNLQASFENGIAIGSVPIDPDTRAQILDNLEGFYVNVHNEEYPDGAVRAQLGMSWILPVVGKAVGQNNTNFVTDVRILNESTDSARIRIDFFPSTLTGLAGPSDSRTITIPGLTQAVLNDVLGDLFNESGLGAMTFVSSRELRVIGRVINDLSDQGLGTNGLFLEAAPIAEASERGSFPFLSHASPTEIAAGEGFRTNVGFFNTTDDPVQMTMQIHRSSTGAVVGSETINIAPHQHLQQSIFQLVTNVPEEDQDKDDFFATWTATGPIFVYAAVTDNTTGDAMVLD